MTTDPYAFEEEMALSLREKMARLNVNHKLFHIIYAQQFSKEDLELICKLATIMRKISTSVQGVNFLRSLLAHKSAMLYFTQPSTRTFLSFVRACQYLGMSYAEVRDPSTSSALKGESDIDGVRTFSSYFDLIIMRHHEAGFAERTAFLMNKRRPELEENPLSVISAGSGKDEHPTQALLDVYTLKRCFERRVNGLDKLHVTFMGDVKRGRTVRSLTQLLTLYKDIEVTYVSPDELRIDKDLASFLKRNNVSYTETGRIEDVLETTDVIYVTRIQDEYDVSGESKSIDYTRFHLTLERANRMKPEAIVMHPLPRRAELDPRIDDTPRAQYWAQERNGMWVRSALIAYIMNAESKILDYYSENYSY